MIPGYREFLRLLSLRRMVLAFAIFWPLIASAQSTPTSANKPASADGTPAASGASGNAAIETEMLSYEAMNTIAHEIALRLGGANPSGCGQKVLMQDSSTIAQITAFEAFDVTTGRLLNSYKRTGEGFVSGGTVTDTLSQATGILTAIRSTAAYTSQTFQPTAASMSNLMAAQLGKLSPSFSVYSTTNPGDLLAASKAISDRMSELDDAQATVTDATKRKDLDAQYTALKTQLAAASPDGTMLATIIKGQALVTALSGAYCVLNYSVDGAGGESRTAHPFFWEVLLPSPRPSYSGGAVVSFVYLTHDGKFLAGGDLRYMFGFSKLHGCKLTEPSNFGTKKEKCPEN
ncbi:MAG: hypothetical protein WBQ95_05265 [Terracidiphilus sp.]